MYSVANGKANVFVCCPENTSHTINDLLIREHFGEFVEEDYISKDNHLMRRSQHDNVNNNVNCVDPMVRDYFNEENDNEVEPPPIPKCKSKLRLKGPYSSLSIVMHGLTEATRNANVIVDKQSINSVILENDPQVCYPIQLHCVQCK